MGHPASGAAAVVQDDDRESRINEIVEALAIFLRMVAHSYQHAQNPAGGHDEIKPDFRKNTRIIAGQILEIELTSREVFLVFQKANLKAGVTISGYDMLQILAYAFTPELDDADDAFLKKMFSMTVDESIN